MNNELKLTATNSLIRDFQFSLVLFHLQLKSNATNILSDPYLFQTLFNSAKQGETNHEPTGSQIQYEKFRFHTKCFNVLDFGSIIKLEFRN